LAVTAIHADARFGSVAMLSRKVKIPRRKLWGIGPKANKAHGARPKVLKAPATDSVALKNEASFEVLDPERIKMNRDGIIVRTRGIAPVAHCAINARKQRPPAHTRIVVRPEGHEALLKGWARADHRNQAPYGLN
jgi:hypothetical protein